MKNKIRFLFLSIILLPILWGPSIPSYATNQNHSGGQVTVDGKITFFEEKTTSSSMDDSDVTTSNGKSVFRNNLPNTGEKRNIVYGFFGCLLLNLLIFFFIKKRRQHNEQ